jgi:hypothetical protein
MKLWRVKITADSVSLLIQTRSFTERLMRDANDGNYVLFRV